MPPRPRQHPVAPRPLRRQLRPGVAKRVLLFVLEGAAVVGCAMYPTAISIEVMTAILARRQR